jgi:hypothetical protein
VLNQVQNNTLLNQIKKKKQFEASKGEILKMEGLK